MTEEEKEIKKAAAEKKKRDKQLSILKASNEMIEETKRKAREFYGDDEDSENLDSVLASLSTAHQENIMMGKSYLNATEQEINDSKYHGPNASAVKQYEERLRKKGITDEELRRKDISSNATVIKQKNDKPKRKSAAQKRKELAEGVNNTEDTLEDNISIKEKKKIKRVDGIGKDNHNPSESIVTSEELLDDGSSTKTKKRGEKFISSDTETVKFHDSEEIKKFDLSDIPDYVQYDIIPLPSKGECYAHKKGRIPVAYLTAADENIIASPNMYRNGDLIDVILKRKVLDKSINVDDLCSGDRDAIVIWLRATAYGAAFPIIATNPNDGKQYNTTVQLDELEYKPFALKGDENGYFHYKSDRGDDFTFSYSSKKDEETLKESITNEVINIGRVNLLRDCRKCLDDVAECNFEEDIVQLITENLDDVIDNIQDIEDDGDNEKLYTDSITKQMIMFTRAINGNTDREYIKTYIENMRSNDAMKYRTYVYDNKPGVDLELDINIPRDESEGGDISFNTFLKLEDTVFINV